MEFRRPRGTLDIFSEKASLWHFLKQKGRELFEHYGYQEIITPIFEQTELFAQGIGEATEIVQKEMYTFKDRSDRSLTLRPEGTAPVVRAYLENGLSRYPKPVKLYYIGQMFRYERPQAGRYREFWQMGVEAVGSSDPALDAEVIHLLLRYLQGVGLIDLKIIVNSMGCKKCRSPFVSKLREYFDQDSRGAKLCSDCKRRLRQNPLRVFDCKKEGCQNLLGGAPSLLDTLCEECRSHWDEVKKYLGYLSLSYEVDPLLVRGFDYYTRTTFEILSTELGAQNALGGGGRYDGLIEAYGGPDTPAIGFAIGLERVALALKSQNVKLNSYSKPEIFVVYVEATTRTEAFKMTNYLRDQGIAADMDYNVRGLRSQMKLANKRKAEYALIIGPEELEKNKALIRNMSTGEQLEVGFEQITSWVKAKRESRRESKGK